MPVFERGSMTEARMSSGNRSSLREFTEAAAEMRTAASAARLTRLCLIRHPGGFWQGWPSARKCPHNTWNAPFISGIRQRRGRRDPERPPPLRRWKASQQCPSPGSTADLARPSLHPPWRRPAPLLGGSSHRACRHASNVVPLPADPVFFHPRRPGSPARSTAPPQSSSGPLLGPWNVRRGRTRRPVSSQPPARVCAEHSCTAACDTASPAPCMQRNAPAGRRRATDVAADA